jgi:hypothetical protein
MLYRKLLPSSLDSPDAVPMQVRVLWRATLIVCLTSVLFCFCHLSLFLRHFRGAPDPSPG